MGGTDGPAYALPGTSPEEVRATRIKSVTQHQSLDTLLIYAYEVERDSDPAEAYVDYGAKTLSVNRLT
jgi:hypothetical protein